MVFVDKNSDLCLLHKIKSFDLKKYQICFWELEKIGFWFVKDQICFMMIKKKKWFLITEKKKSQICFSYVQKIWTRFFMKRVSLIKWIYAIWTKQKKQS